MYFGARGGMGAELYKLDGTTGRVSLVADIFVGGNSSQPEGLIEFDNDLYFTARDDAHGYEIHKLDGLTGEISLAVDVWEGSDTSPARDLIEFNGGLYFSADDGINGRELHALGADGELVLHDLTPGHKGSNPEGLFVLDDLLYFVADTPTQGRELWTYDGATFTIIDINKNSAGIYPQSFTVVDTDIWA